MVVVKSYSRGKPRNCTAYIENIKWAQTKTRVKGVSWPGDSRPVLQPERCADLA